MGGNWFKLSKLIKIYIVTFNLTSEFNEKNQGFQGEIVKNVKIYYFKYFFLIFEKNF